jgi:hypothetical protein
MSDSILWRDKNFRCRNCMFYQQQHCHRHPPQANARSASGNIWEYPSVDWDDWCGEWEENKVRFVTGLDC